ncbi:MAG: DUF1801 domain-containing protein [Kineosporiaceae bacterium]|nr:DUF1801 domain-containing protein [Kineosporiaceae bacterium]
MARTVKKTSAPGEDALTAVELAAMRERAQEARASRRASGGGGREAAAQAVVDRIAQMDETDRAIAGRLHEIITSTAPELAPKLWYGMPAYARDGKVVCFVQEAKKFETRYLTLGFQDTAHLDDGVIWPTSFAVIRLTAEVERRIAELVRQAITDPALA